MDQPFSRSDEQLAVEALRGDQQAFTSLYQQYFDQVYDLASRVLKDSAAAADVSQNVFMKFLSGAEVKPPQVSFRAWLYTMTRNAAIDELRRRQRVIPIAGSEMEEEVFSRASTSAEDDPEQVALDNELAALVWEAAQSLNANDYTLLDLNIRKGLEPDELADALGISRGNVYTRLSRLRDSLEEAVTALILARRGRHDCSQLNDLLLGFASPEGTTLTPRGRRAVGRHILECSTCEANRRRYLSAAALFGGLAAVLPAAALKNEIWGGLLAGAAGAAAPPPQPPPPPASATVLTEVARSPAQFWSSLGPGVQVLVAGMVVAGAIGAAVATAFLLPRFFSGTFPTIIQFRLVDPDVGPDGIARNRELQVQLQVDEESEANIADTSWLINEGSPGPSPQDPGWTSSPPSTYILSAGDGPKSVDLWLKDQRNRITHASQFQVLLDTTSPQDPSGAFSSSHQIATPSTNNLVTVQWEPAQDPEPGSGIAGYSVDWDRFPESLPDGVLDLDEPVVETTSPRLEVGTWYLHLSTLDRAGNYTTTLHLGPFIIVDSLFAQGPSGTGGGSSDSPSEPGPGGESGPPSGDGETVPGVEQPELPQPLVEPQISAPPGEGSGGPESPIPPDTDPDEPGGDGGDGPGSGDNGDSGGDGSGGGGGPGGPGDNDDDGGDFRTPTPTPTVPPPGGQPQSSLEVVVAGNPQSKVGDVVTYSYSIINSSSNDTPPLILDDLIDTLLGNLNSAAIEAGCGTLRPEDSCSFELSRQVQPEDPDPLVNTVTANYHQQGFGQAISSSDSHSVDLFQPSVTISKTGEALSTVGDLVDYIITVRNTSSPDSPDLTCTITDPLLGINKKVSLAAGLSDVTRASRTVLEGDPDPLINTAEVTCTVNGLTNVLGPISDSHSVDLFQPSVAVSVSGPPSAVPGDNVTYDYIVTNTSSSDAPDLALASFIDDLLGDLGSEAAEAGCDLLSSGDTCFFGASRQVQEGDPDPLINTVEVHYQPVGFSNDIRAADSHTIDLFQPSVQPSVMVTVSGPSRAVPGDNVTYNYIVTNTSSSDAPDLALTSFIDDLLGDLGSEAAEAGCDLLSSGDTCSFGASRQVQEGDPDPLVNTVEVHYQPAGFSNDITAADSHSVDILVSMEDEPEVFLEPQESVVEVGQLFEVQIKVDPKGKPVAGVQAFVDFDAAKLEVQDLDESRPGVQIRDGDVLIDFQNLNDADNLLGQVDYAAGNLSGGSAFPTQEFVLATIQFKALESTQELPTLLTFSTSPATRATKVSDPTGQNITGPTRGATVQIIEAVNPGTNLSPAGRILSLRNHPLIW